MNNKILYALWGGMYLLCAGLSLIGTPAPALSLVMTVFSILFFAPPALLLINARRRGDQKTQKTLRLLSLVSLGATLLFFIANILSILGSALLGDILYYVLLFVSVPMVCSRHFLLSLFLWACLLFCTLPKKRTN